MSTSCSPENSSTIIPSTDLDGVRPSIFFIRPYRFQPCYCFRSSHLTTKSTRFDRPTLIAFAQSRRTTSEIGVRSAEGSMTTLSVTYRPCATVVTTAVGFARMLYVNVYDADG